MRTLLVVTLSALCSLLGGVAEAQQISKRDYEPVLKYQNDRERFIEAVRAYDRAQGFLAQADQMIADEYIKEDNRGMANAKLRKANERIKNVRELYQYALRQYPESALLRNYYGELLYDRYGDIPGALMEWNKAISSDSRLSHPYNNLGLHELHSGNYASGLRNLEKALELDPKNPDYLFNMAQTYLVHWPQVQQLRGMDADKVFKEAMKMSKQAAEIAPDEYELVVDYAVNFYVGENMGVKVNWKDAAKAWQTARKIARTSEETFYTWINEARVWIEQGNSSEATRCLKAALEIRPQSALAQKMLREQNPQYQPESEPEPEPQPQQQEDAVTGADAEGESETAAPENDENTPPDGE